MKKNFKSIRTKLERDRFFPRKTDEFQVINPYRNSNSPKEGLTLSRKDLQKFTEDTNNLKAGTRLEIAVLVDGMDKLPVIQCHVNARGGYITGKVADYHEGLGHLPTPRIAMGDRRKGTDYHIKVVSIQWFPAEPSELESETSTELQSGVNTENPN